MNIFRHALQAIGSGLKSLFHREFTADEMTEHGNIIIQQATFTNLCDAMQKMNPSVLQLAVSSHRMQYLAQHARKYRVRKKNRRRLNKHTAKRR